MKREAGFSKMLREASELLNSKATDFTDLINSEKE
jgi:hypothetical protein